MSRTAVVLQARMNSRTLRGSALMKIGRRSMLEHCLMRLDQSGLPLIVGTTTLAEDDAIAAEADRSGVQVFRGDPTNALARCIGAAHAFDLAAVVRASAVNPFVDGDSPNRLLTVLENVGADHIVECGLPVGAGVEVVKVATLVSAESLITDEFDREHVTSFIRRDGRFRALRAMAPRSVRWPGLRLTGETQADLDFLRRIDDELGARLRPATLPEVMKAAETVLVETVGRHVLQRGA